MSSSTIRLPGLLVLLLAIRTVSGSARYGAMEDAVGFSPRYYLGASPDLSLERRQSGECGTNQHSCADVGGSVCCLNSQYCIVGSDFIASCCPIGSSCGNQCNSASYQCPTTTSVSGTATVLATCCPRACPATSAFKCASALGGGCCSFGSSCIAGGSCATTIQSSTTKAAIVSEVPSGCTTSQFACASSLGGGCCNNGLACTVVSNVNYCASNSAMATRTGSEGTTSTGAANTTGSSGLSTGAKAGIGAGVAGVAVAIIAGLLWFCIAKRRNANRGSRHGGSDPQRSSAPAMSQGSNSAAEARRRQTSDYFGPTAAVGPYTESEHHGSEKGPGMMAVPAKPHSPGDIAVPVEIDSRTTSNLPSPGDFGYKATSPVELA